MMDLRIALSYHRGTKVSAPLVFAEGKEYNKRRSFGGGGISLN